MKKWLLIVVIVVAATVTAGVLVRQPWAPDTSVAENNSQQTATGVGWSATASFAGEPELGARVEQSELDEKQNAVLRSATTLRALADFTVKGQLPPWRGHRFFHPEQARG